ncbi:MAG: 6-hydroxymethylpterin diphosphokinase MptE-like protein [Phycisphaerales bacterium JB043]
MSGITTKNTPVEVSTTLARNLRALRVSHPSLADRIESTAPATDVEFLDTPQGVPGARYLRRSLCSRKRPLEEGHLLASSIEYESSGLIVIIGFAMGYHVKSVLDESHGLSEVLVLETDIPLLRSVLERVDHSDWLNSPRLHIITNAEDPALLASILQGHEPFVAMGVRILEHPPSVARLEAFSTTFSQNIASLVGAIRTMVVTTMVQTEVTIRNALMNLDAYLLAHDSPHAGIADLHGLCSDRPAIVVAAGPSLARTIDALRTPGLRDRCVIIAAQTALRPLLDAGVRPHFVSALDYHAISTRFYEGLTEDDVRGITLIAEPKVNPAVPLAWPGMIRCPSDTTLDMLLGTDPQLHGQIPSGSTVAHLNYYIARHLGCDPVILTGQDLGFTDGQYYADGASIHSVWACELNPFTTLEMLEWERIVRGRATLRKTHDNLGREIYTDEQMSAYQSQFEREFLADTSRGLRVIDATEGGTRKTHTSLSTLRDAIDEHAPPNAPPLSPIPDAPLRTQRTPSTIAEARRRLQSIRHDVVRFSELSRRSRSLLEKASRITDDERALKPLIDEVYELRDEAHALQPAFDLVQRLNQTGAFNRSRADRNLRLRVARQGDVQPAQVRAQQLERDITNVTWLADAGDELAGLLHESARSLDSDERPTELPSPRIESSDSNARDTRVWIASAILDEGDADSLRRTIERVRAIDGIDEIVVIGDESTEQHDGCLIHRCDLTQARERLRHIRMARRFSRHCWRSGVNALTCFDEITDPTETHRAIASTDATGVLLVGSTWRDLDVSSCARIIERHRKNPEQHRVVFSQSPPERAGVLVSIDVLSDLAEAREQRSPFATIGGLLRFNPMHPAADPIAGPLCVPIDHIARDAPWNGTDESLPTLGGPVPHHLLIELTTRRSSTGGLRDRWLASRPGEPIDADGERVASLLDTLHDQRPDTCVSFAGLGDPLLHTDLPSLVSHARELGLATHVRTDLLHDDEFCDALLDARPDVLSVDVMALDAATHERVTGSTRWDALTSRLESVWNKRVDTGTHEQPWLVARTTRCDALYEQIERFYDFWVAHTGSAVIDPLPRRMEGERIAPLTLPRVARRARNATTLCVRADGLACLEVGDHCLGDTLQSSSDSTLESIWNAALGARFGVTL